MIFTDKVTGGCAAAGLGLLLVSVSRGPGNYVLRDYAFTLLTLSGTIALASRHWVFGRPRDFERIRTPASIWLVFCVGVAAAFLTNLAQVLSLLLGSARGEAPPGAASLAAAAAQTQKPFAFILVVAAVFAGLGVERFARGSRIGAAFRPDTRPNSFWLVVYGVPLAASVLAAVASLLTGYFLYFIPFLAWAAFFCLLLAGKRRYLLSRSRPVDAS